MNSIIEALRVEIDDDLTLFLAFLFEKGIPHRIFEESGQQVLVVSRQSDVDLVNQFYTSWKLGRLSINTNSKPAYTSGLKIRVGLFTRNPICLSLILLSCLGFICAYWLTSYELVSWLTFSPFTFEAGGIKFGSIDNQYWRIFTPSFLHFGWLHLVFNCLWLWELGRKIERSFGSLILLGHFVSVAGISNLAQNMWAGPSLFGGMSGVVYGLLGFCWAESRINPMSSLRLPTALLWFMLGWLFVCMIGLVEAVGFGAIANSAHVGGLLSGVLLGIAAGFFR